MNRRSFFKACAGIAAGIVGLPKLLAQNKTKPIEKPKDPEAFTCITTGYANMNKQSILTTEWYMNGKLVTKEIHKPDGSVTIINYADGNLYLDDIGTPITTYV